MAQNIRDVIYSDDKKQSFEIGVSRIYQYFEKPNQLNEKLVIKIENHLNKLTNSFFNIKDCNILVGSSGSFKTFYELIHNKQYGVLYLL